ncbi:uncharacterized protein LOC124780314 [Schistocerca piceifrons]|uniref:uncharacterized protein LOC124780314 n=1 Tax=Schistocerca piceifrons TaxID=274613 RepID=UPI001F5EE00D|nr:uncharacterized protein LOC124780314 [Schistocerca piceifrons]
MHPWPAAASWLLFLAANGTTKLDCFCTHVADVYYQGGGLRFQNDGEENLWLTYCVYPRAYKLEATCENLERLSAAAPAVARLLQLQSPAEERERGCAGALEQVREFSEGAADEFSVQQWCLIADHLAGSCSVLGLDDTDWNEETLATDHLRRPVLSQLLRALRQIMKAVSARRGCADQHDWNFRQQHLNKSEFEADYSVYLEHLANYTQDIAHLISLGVTHTSQVFVPLAFEHMGIHPNDQRLHGWIKDVRRVRDMLHTKLRGWVHDMQSVSEQMMNYKIEEDKNSSGIYLIRRPLLNHRLLAYQTQFLSFHDDFSALCEEQHPKASEMFGLANALYSLYRNSWIETARIFNENNSSYFYIVDEEWQLKDRSNATLSVDTGCLQLLADALDHPTCPLEDLPPETIEQREQCRVQLWDDMVQRLPHIPVTSYLAYTQRASVNLCLLAWMSVNSFSVCQDVSFSMIQSVDDARCFFGSPDHKSCPELNVTYAICSVSRAILLLKCRDFSFHKQVEVCGVSLRPDGLHSEGYGLRF